MRAIKSLIICLVVFGITTSTTAALADIDDYAPHGPDEFFSGNVVLMSAPHAGGFGTNGSISTTTDNDYYVFTCGKAYGSQGIVKKADITMPATTGDLDIEVYGVDGAFLGGGYTKNSKETVELSWAGRSTVVLRVYGYKGAKGGYAYYLTCQ